MRDSPFDASDETPLIEGLPIVEDTDDRKVIVLSPRESQEIGLGCTVCLFIPAVLLCLPIIFPEGRGQSPWFLGAFLVLAVVAPIMLVQWSRTVCESEETVILETNRITLRHASFDRRTGELLESKDESVELGLGSGFTVVPDDDDHRTLVIWGPAASLSIRAKSATFPWLKRQVQDWLQRNVFSKDDSIALEQRSQFASPPGTLLALSEVNRETLHVHIAAGGPTVTSFGWASFFQFLFVTAFGTLWYLFAPDFDWMPIVICAVLWLGTVVIMCVWIRRRLETVDLHVTTSQIIVTRTLLGWQSQREIELGASPSVRLEVAEWHGLTPIPKLCVKGSYEDTRFGTMLSDQEKRWLVMRLRAFLKLDLRTNIFAEPEG